MKDDSNVQKKIKTDMSVAESVVEAVEKTVEEAVENAGSKGPEYANNYEIHASNPYLSALAFLADKYSELFGHI
jgi:hypothetical protein